MTKEIQEFEDLVQINKAVSAYGGSYGVRDEFLILSAIGRGETAKCYGVDEKSAIFVTVESLVKNHPFVDGNKRTALVWLIMSLHKTGMTYHGPGIELANFIDLLASNTFSNDVIEKYITQKIGKTPERPNLEEIIMTNPLKTALDILARKDAGELTPHEEKLMKRHTDLIRYTP